MLPFSTWELIVGFLLFHFCTFSCFFLLAKKINQYSTIDIWWSFSFSLAAILHFLLALIYLVQPYALFPFVIMMVFWSLRLSYFLFRRLRQHYPEEDARYQNLRQYYGNRLHSGFYFFFLFQALTVSFLTLPLSFVLKNSLDVFWPLAIFALLLFTLSFLGEWTADQQLSAFKKNPNNKGLVCKVGLWRYSRHPNYFFEFLMWVSWTLYLISIGGSWWSLYAPLFMAYLLLKVTGIPWNEAQNLKTKGELYAEYQRTTSIFIPLQPKENPEAD